jgi:N-acetyl-alpha-D-muramate 1-phosphate uridylyltransferase
VKELPPVCILAGGLGTRLGRLVADTPKPLLEVAGRPFLAHQLELLRRHGARRVVLCVGYLGERIEARIGDGSELGLTVRYVYDSPELDGTAGAIRNASEELGNEFLVLYGDTYLRVDYGGVVDAFRKSGKLALMTVLRNEGAWDRSNAVYADGVVVRYDKESPGPDMKWIDYGLGALRRDALDVAGETEPHLPAVYRQLASEGQLAGYEATERFYEIGTEASLAETDAFLRGLSVPAGP